MLYRILYFILWPLIKIFFPVKIVGKENIEPKKNYLIMCNHRSSFDVVLIFNNFYKRKYFLGKKELFNKKFNAWFYKTIGVIPIDRKGVDLSAIKSSIKTLNSNKDLVIFPEGTRANDDELTQFKNGGTMIALKAKKEILPIRFVNKPRMFRVSKIVVGKPINLSKFFDSKLTKDVLDEAGKQIISALK